MKKTTVLVLNTKNTHQPNASWKISKETFKKVKYIVTEENGHVKRVYTASGVKQKDSGRCNFINLRRVAPEIERKYLELDVSRIKGEANPCRYKKV